MPSVTHCPLCDEILTWYGSDPACSNCVIDGRLDEWKRAMDELPTRIDGLGFIGNRRLLAPQT